MLINETKWFYNLPLFYYKTTKLNYLNSFYIEINYRINNLILVVTLLRTKVQQGRSSDRPCGEQNRGSESIFPPMSTPLPSTPQLFGVYTIYVFLFGNSYSMRSVLRHFHCFGDSFPKKCVNSLTWNQIHKFSLWIKNYAAAHGHVWLV